MTKNRINVLIYAGDGCTVEAVKHCIYSLRRLLSPYYAVRTIGGEAILTEPWAATCALLVFPGGADLPYCRTLNGEGNRRIEQYVARGGRYLGFCAGGYFASSFCDFERGNKQLEVIGKRELAFFPGTCRGLAFAGFRCGSEAGARAVRLKVNTEGLSGIEAPDEFLSYYNGGGVFVDAPKFEDQGIQVLASYESDLKVDPGEGKAAVVFCQIEQGAAVLTCTHPEFAAVNLNKHLDVPGYKDLVSDLAEDDMKRSIFLTSCLLKLELRVSRNQSVPSLSPLHISSLDAAALKTIMADLDEIVQIVDGEEYIKDANDTFKLERSTSSGSDAPSVELESLRIGESQEGSFEEEMDIDYNAVTKRLIVHDVCPLGKETPYFDHRSFYTNLKHFTSQSANTGIKFGNVMLYGDVVTSTNTILEKNQQLLHRLPTGFTATANVQVAGRGRGSNVWVSPAGSLIFSTVIRHSQKLSSTAPVTFIQYLTAIAIVEGIKSYDRGYQRMPIKLKWPNDIYAIQPGTGTPVKIGGILVNSHYTSDEFLCVVGAGINTTNAEPTTSLNALKPPYPFTLEKLLARILTTFQTIYERFTRTGFDAELEQRYYACWLHTDQIVTLEEEGGARAKIRGITRDWGLLIAEELKWVGDEEICTGRKWTLQPDSNSFDFFKGLVKSKK